MRGSYWVQGTRSTNRRGRCRSSNGGYSSSHERRVTAPGVSGGRNGRSCCYGSSSRSHRRTCGSSFVTFSSCGRTWFLPGRASRWSRRSYRTALCSRGRNGASTASGFGASYLRRLVSTKAPQRSTPSRPSRLRDSESAVSTVSPRLAEQGEAGVGPATTVGKAGATRVSVSAALRGATRYRTA